MTAKKRWPSLQTESQELIEQISWNSNSSEESEDEVRNRKKFKPYFPNFKHDMNLAVINPIKLNINFTKRRKEVLIKCESTESTNGRNISTFISEENANDVGRKSPILESAPKFTCLSKSDSPIISQNYSFRQTSPVLTNKEIIKKIRNKKREIINRSTKIDRSSPDIFLSQYSKIIEEYQSPDKSILAATNCSQEMGSIELISSQDSSNLEIVNPSTSESSITGSDFSNQCYHQPSPRRKNCKKNGLFYQVQRSLRLQKSRISLWHHDIFCKNVILYDLDHIQGIINRKWKDFGCTILYCSKDIRESSESQDVFLISLGCTTDSNLEYNIGQIITVFPPFKDQLVHFENKEVKMYYNISKILIESASESVSSS